MHNRDVCNLSRIFERLESLPGSVAAVSSELSRVFQCFCDAVKDFDNDPTCDRYEAINSQILAIMDLSDDVFTLDGVSLAVFVAMEVHRASKALLDGDLLKCHSHMNNALCVEAV